ncbi:MAG: cytochrome b/b6 domain-containing protein [Aphanocapsa lilacina HA4352-LM1]|jgi:cytochrome b561|nr:cytochrome b/b6 domain-containing protein [Aphanocapsa lilacina HA4352-LM1]
MAASRSAARNWLWVVHWVMAISFVILFATGMIMTELPREVAYRPSLYSFHKSMGVLILFLVGARILVMIRSLAPARPKNWLPVAGLHTALYTFMVVVPLSGYFYSNTAGREVAVFGVPMPTLFGENKAFAEVAGEAHGWIAYLFASLIAVHLLAQRKYMLGAWKRLSRRMTAGA